MSGLIKSGNLAGIAAVQPIVIINPSVPPILSLCKQDEEQDRLHKRIAQLEENARQHDLAVEVLREDVRRAFEEGHVAGRKAGMGEANDLRSAQLAILEKAIGQSQAGLSDAITSLSRLSALLARDCVEMILGNADDRAELISQIVETQMARIDRTALLAIELSREDFPDDESIELLSACLDVGAVRITAQSSLASGGCMMTMRLGKLDVGLNQQWGCLRDVLEEMSQPVDQA